MQDPLLNVIARLCGEREDQYNLPATWQSKKVKPKWLYSILNIALEFVFVFIFYDQRQQRMKYNVDNLSNIEMPA